MRKTAVFLACCLAVAGCSSRSNNAAAPQPSGKSHGPVAPSGSNSPKPAPPKPSHSPAPKPSSKSTKAPGKTPNIKSVGIKDGSILSLTIGKPLALKLTSPADWDATVLDESCVLFYPASANTGAGSQARLYALDVHCSTKVELTNGTKTISITVNVGL